ncbi:unnamed protein product [Trichogramma brassicae]|uniref:Uncharacterized protein n=1 Tax=Trichogramma brassicae TaxID=86971 RepID=A0A6H5HXS2_9HYME|nr:unnamed protein product [Trichogramma brassicae]
MNWPRPRIRPSNRSIQLVLQGPGRKFRGRRELGILSLQCKGATIIFPVLAFTIVYGDVRGVGSGPSSIRLGPPGFSTERLPLRAPQPVAHGCRTCRESHAPLCSPPRCEASTHTSARCSHRQLGNAGKHRAE